MFWCLRRQDRSPVSASKVPSKFHSKSARNCVLMIWSAVLAGRDREISEWKPIEWPHFREAAEVEQQIVRSKAGCRPEIPKPAPVPAEPWKIVFFLARPDNDRFLIQSAAKLPNTHCRTVIYALNDNRTRNWSIISIKLRVRFFGYLIIISMFFELIYRRSGTRVYLSPVIRTINHFQQINFHSMVQH